mmetsp:Transcript_22707/g.73515  ORF Transcript_22707/g.73515 Transcript_22707/m.73515 type:complete len:532 (-) Transcript_22707:580-2175(-)
MRHRPARPVAYDRRIHAGLFLQGPAGPHPRRGASRRPLRTGARRGPDAARSAGPVLVRPDRLPFADRAGLLRQVLVPRPQHPPRVQRQGPHAAHLRRQAWQGFGQHQRIQQPVEAAAGQIPIRAGGGADARAAGRVGCRWGAPALCGGQRQWRRPALPQCGVQRGLLRGEALAAYPPTVCGHLWRSLNRLAGQACAARPAQRRWHAVPVRAGAGRHGGCPQPLGPRHHQRCLLDWDRGPVLRQPSLLPDQRCEVQSPLRGHAGPAAGAAACGPVEQPDGPPACWHARCQAAFQRPRQRWRVGPGGRGRVEDLGRTEEWGCSRRPYWRQRGWAGADREKELKGCGRAARGRSSPRAPSAREAAGRVRSRPGAHRNAAACEVAGLHQAVGAAAVWRGGCAQTGASATRRRVRQGSRQLLDGCVCAREQGGRHDDACGPARQRPASAARDWSRRSDGQAAHGGRPLLPRFRSASAMGRRAFCLGKGLQVRPRPQPVVEAGLHVPLLIAKGRLPTPPAPARLRPALPPRGGTVVE